MPTELAATITGDQYTSPAFQWQQSFDEGMTWVDIPGANAMTFFTYGFIQRDLLLSLSFSEQSV